MMNYVLDRNADVRQVCLILTISYRVINFHPFRFVTAVPYDVKRFCFAGGVLRMWSDGAVRRRGVHHGLYRSVRSRENVREKMGALAETFLLIFERPIWKWEAGGRGGGEGMVVFKFECLC